MNTTAPRSTGRRVLAATVGIVLVVIGLGCLATAPFLSDFTSETAEFETEGYAVLGDSWDEDVYSGGGLIESTRIEVTPEGDAPIFVGFAAPEDAEAYLGAVQRTYFHRGSASHGPTVEEADGSAPTGLPGDQDIWVAQAEGEGVQTLDLDTGDLDGGEYVPVAMNADGTPALGGEVAIDYDIPAMPWFTTGLVVIGLAGLGGGVWLIVRSRRAA